MAKKQIRIVQSAQTNTDTQATDEQVLVDQTDSTDETVTDETVVGEQVSEELPAEEGVIVQEQAEVIEQPAEIESTPEVIEPLTLEQVVTEQSVGVATEAVVNYGVVLSMETEQFLQQLQQQAPGVFVQFNTIFSYIQDMEPGKMIDPDQGSLRHTHLYAAIKNIITRSGDHFRLAFTCLLFVIKDHSTNGVFAMQYASRFPGTGRMSPADWKGYNMVMNLLREVAPVAGRKEALKCVSLEKSLRGHVSEEAQRLIQDYLAPFAG